MKITHPIAGYSGPVAGPVRLHFVDGVTESTDVKAGARKALEDAGFTFESTRPAKKADAGASDPA